MKKIVLLVSLVLALTLAFSGCAPTNPDETTATTEATQATEPGEATESTEATTETTEATEPSETTEPTEPEPTLPEEGHEHSYEVAVKAPTCTEDGYTLHKCSCGDEYKDEETEATGHQWGPWVTTKNPTTTKEGQSERTCSVCDEKETKKLDKLPESHKHSYKKTVVKPTCTTGGYTLHECSCGSSYISDETPKTAHNYSTKVTKPTCTSKGYTTYTCKDCGHVVVKDYTDKVAHDYKTEVVKPTCTTEGYTKHTCKNCGHITYTDLTQKVPHNYKDTVIAPTCTEDGYTSRVCKDCGHKTTTNPTKKLGHDYKSTVVEATCQAGGYTLHECTRCDSSYKDNQTPVGAHKTKVETKDPTCADAGYKKEVCTVCGQVVKQETIPADPSKHVWEWRSLSVQAEIEDDKFESTGDWQAGVNFGHLVGYDDHVCKCCTICDIGDYSTIKWRDDAASVMDGYVQDLRDRTYGEYASRVKVKMDSGLNSKAAGRALDISVEFSHDGCPQDCSENISTGTSYKTVEDFFYAFYNSSAHRKIMLSSSLSSSLDIDAGMNDYQSVGYGFYSTIRQGTIGDASQVTIENFAVQLFKYGGSLNP